jgi:hypothetical protein
MKDKRKNIDAIFREKLGERSFSVPDIFLEDLNHRLDKLDKTKKRRSIFWWFLFFLIVIVGSSVLYLICADKSSNVFGYSMNKKPYKEKNSLDRRMKDTGSSFQSANYQSIKHDFYANSEIPQESDLVGTNKSLLPTNYIIQSKRKLGYQNKSELKRKPTFYSTVVDEFEHNKTDNSPIASNGNDTKTAYNDTSKIDVSALISITSDSLQQEKAEKAINSEKVESNLLNDSSNNSIEDEETKVKKWELIAYAGCNSISSIFDEIESPILTPQIGLEVYYQKNALAIGSGLFFQQNGEKTNYQVSDKQWVDSIYISSYEQDSIWNNETQTFDVFQVPVYDSVSVQKTILSNYTLGNRYSWISIPLTFRYNFTMKNLEILPSAGFQFNFGILKNSGIYPNELMNEFIQVDSRKFYLAYNLQVELRKNIRNHFYFLRPQFSSSLMPAVSNAFLERKYNSWGIVIGHVWKL